MFISYAQNFEDVILNRVFADKKEGFYIDVGAQHPLYDSVTKAFYDRGWQGINIEPVQEYYELLAKERDRDINLNLAVGETESKLDFFELEGTGLSTFDRETAERLAQEGNYQINSYFVPVVRLADIFDKYLKRPIDFLKIDVEGWEEQVILGNDWTKFRPTVIVLEATIPNSPTRAKTNITEILKEKDYQKVYFDGLNDYYLAKEHSELSEHFVTPPNVFDKFISYHLDTARNHAKNLEGIIKSREEETINKNQELTNKQQQLEISERYNHIVNNRLKDEKVEIQRLTKIDIQLNQEIANLQIKLTEKNQELMQIKQTLAGIDTQVNHKVAECQNQLQSKEQELVAANQLIAAMKTSKFWKMRTAWFGIKNTLGIGEQG